MKKNLKIARGYRLYPETHKYIAKIQRLLKSDSDKAINNACLMFIQNYELEKIRAKEISQQKKD